MPSKGSRVVVPLAGRQAVLELLHEGHPGVCRLKNLSRSYVWWLQIDKEIEIIVKTCYECQQTCHSPPVDPLHPWEWPHRPRARLHIDYAGPVDGKMLLVVDVHSKWLDVAIVTSATSSITIKKLRGMFATHGIPDIIVSDNGTVFTSEEFETFMKLNGIRHVKAAPYHPSTNGIAERALKENLKKSKAESLETMISCFLFKYQTTPHTTTGISPAELLMGRQLCSHLSLLHPDFSLQNRVTNKQQNQKCHHDAHASKRHFTIGDTVFVCDFPSGKNWPPGTLTQSKGPLSFLIKLDDGRVIRRHIDYIQERLATVLLPYPTSCDDWDEYFPSNSNTSPELTKQLNTEPHRSSHTKKPPDHFT